MLLFFGHECSERRTEIGNDPSFFGHKRSESDLKRFVNCVSEPFSMNSSAMLSELGAKKALVSLLIGKQAHALREEARQRTADLTSVYKSPSG